MSEGVLEYLDSDNSQPLPSSVIVSSRPSLVFFVADRDYRADRHRRRLQGVHTHLHFTDQSLRYQPSAMNTRPHKQSMSELKLRRLTEHNQRLREDLARPRVRVSEASARYFVRFLTFRRLIDRIQSQFDSVL